MHRSQLSAVSVLRCARGAVLRCAPCAARLALCALGFALVLGSTGCDLASVLIKAQTDGTNEFMDVKGTSFQDPELVGPFLAGATVMNEGNLYFVPEYEPLLQGAAFSNVAYGMNWLGPEAADAQERGDYAAVENANKRAIQMFKRAAEISKRILRLRDPGYDDAKNSGDIETFKTWVDHNFYEKSDASVLLTAGVSFMVSMLKSEEGMAGLVDIPYAKYLVERSVELNPNAQGSLGLTALGIYWCTVPSMVGGDPKFGLTLLQQAKERTKGQSVAGNVPAAERCAVGLQDRQLFKQLLNEVAEVPDYEKYRLTNNQAKKEAARLLKHEDELFYD
jgi:hypothetical protein